MVAVSFLTTPQQLSHSHDRVMPIQQVSIKVGVGFLKVVSSNFSERPVTKEMELEISKEKVGNKGKQNCCPIMITNSVRVIWG